MELNGKVVVITGESRGFGVELAKTIAAKGAKLVPASRSQAELSQVAGPLGALPVPTDITDQRYVQALCDAAINQFGAVDVPG